METNFAALTPKQKLVWSRDVWQAARDMMFIKKFIGTGDGAMIQRITELTKTEKGEQVIFHLVADLVDDGVIGDNEREGNEEAMQSYSQVVNIDLISHGVRNKGKMADQRTVIKFRETGRDRLAYWLANRIDQLAFLTLSGISYAYHNDGSLRTSTAFANLQFAADVHAPTPKRGLMWQGGVLQPSNTGAITASDTLSYKAIVDLKAYANEHYVRPLMAGGKEYYVCLLRPGSFAQLKKDPDFQRAVTTALPRSEDNPWFTGGTVTIDGVVFHEHRLVYNTRGLPDGSKWGAGGHVDGTRTLLCGAQALGMADLGPPEWNEKTFDYGSKQGINVDKMFGLLKPQFYSIYDKSVEDFGCITLDHAA
jgi:N4-gp56 family major capsid protein